MSETMHIRENTGGQTLDQVLQQREEGRSELVDVDEAMRKMVIFTVAGEQFAFYGEFIREILANAEVFFVPGCPASLEGIINVRGDIETVLRLHEMLHLPESEPARASSILLGRGGGMSSGIRVDRVIDVVDVPQGSLQAPPATLPEYLRPLVLAVFRFDAQPSTRMSAQMSTPLTILLDLERIFADYARGLG